MKKPAHRPKGQRQLTALHPATLAALAGRWTAYFTESGDMATATPAKPEKRQTLAALAASNVAIEPRIVELALAIVTSRHVPLLRPTFDDATKLIARASKIALTVGDAAFFLHMAEAVSMAEKTAGQPKRLVFLKAWLDARETSNPPLLADIRAGMKYRLGHVDPDSPPEEIRMIPGNIGDDEIRNFSKAMGLPYQSCRACVKK